MMKMNRLSDLVRIAKGVSRGALIASVPFLAASALSGCTPWQQQVARRASFDLGCPEAELQVVELGRVEAGVNGCGCRATYTGEGGSWVLNTVSGESCSAAASSGGAAQ
jgi:hypothetical protein